MTHTGPAMKAAPPRLEAGSLVSSERPCGPHLRKQLHCSGDAADDGCVSSIVKQPDTRASSQATRAPRGDASSCPPPQSRARREDRVPNTPAALMSAGSRAWMYLLVTEPLAWPTRAAMVTSVKPGSLAMLAKL